MASRPRIGLIGHRYHRTKQHRSLYESLERICDLRVHYVDDGWPRTAVDLPEAGDLDGCLWFVRFRELRQQPDFDWGSFAGRRWMYDLDTNANYHDLGQHGLIGAYPPEVVRHGFDLLICTGRRSAEELRVDLEPYGIATAWLPKAYDHHRIFELDVDREGLCVFGQPYPSRRAMLAFVRHRGHVIEPFHCHHDQLNEHLNRYLGSVICNMGGDPGRGLRRYASRVAPHRFVRISPGAEPMLKNFEIAGAGCAPMMDSIPELEELGFVDQETAVLYASFDELADKLDHYRNHPDDLRSIGQRAAALARSTHTWDHRARQLLDLLI